MHKFGNFLLGIQVCTLEFIILLVSLPGFERMPVNASLFWLKLLTFHPTMAYYCQCVFLPEGLLLLVVHQFVIIDGIDANLLVVLVGQPTHLAVVSQCT